jgi:hypothetical protein
MSAFFENNARYQKIEVTVPPSRSVVLNLLLPDYSYFYEFKSVLHSGTDYHIYRYPSRNTTDLFFAAGLQGARVTIYYLKDEASQGCNHDFKQYNGFTESYRYCTKCDQKEK